jgi:hypothetical protein
MTVLYVHVEDDWTDFPTNEYQIFADTEAGLAKAIDYAEFHIPWDEGHMKIYFKGCTNKIGKQSRYNIVKTLNEKGYASDWACEEKFPARYHFCIDRQEVLE